MHFYSHHGGGGGELLSNSGEGRDTSAASTCQGE